MKWLFENLRSAKAKLVEIFNIKKCINNTLNLPFIYDHLRSSMLQSVITYDRKRSPMIESMITNDTDTLTFVGNDENFVGSSNTEQHQKSSIFSNSKFANLTVNETALLCLIYDQCTTKQDNLSDYISILQVAELFGFSPQSARRLITRFDKKTGLKCRKIRQKNFVYRQYELDPETKEILSNLRVSKREKCITGNIDFSDISSSNINIININNKYKTTTNFVDSLEPRSDNPKDPQHDSQDKRIENTSCKSTGGWNDVNYSPLEKIGFRKNHLQQLEKLNKPEIVQESIKHFAWALENCDKIKKHTAPLNMLMGVLRKGNIWLESGYETQDQIAMKNFLAERKKQKSEMEKLIDDAMHAEFDEWLTSKTQEEFLKIVPKEFVTGERLKAGREACLRKHFREEVLIPALKQRGILKNKWEI